MLKSDDIIKTVQSLDLNTFVELAMTPKRNMLKCFFEGHMRKCSKNDELRWALSYYLIHYNYKILC